MPQEHLLDVVAFIRGCRQESAIRKKTSGDGDAWKLNTIAPYCANSISIFFAWKPVSGKEGTLQWRGFADARDRSVSFSLPTFYGVQPTVFLYVEGACERSVALVGTQICSDEGALYESSKHFQTLHGWHISYIEMLYVYHIFAIYAFIDPRGTTPTDRHIIYYAIHGVSGNLYIDMAVGQNRYP